ncbi:MAG: 6-bladed beta-propeller [Acidobacteriota bacterium]
MNLHDLASQGHVRIVLGRRGYAAEAPDRFDQPTDITFSRDGSIFVTDGYGNSRVVKYTSKGEFVAAWGHKDTGPGKFQLPHSIVIDDRDRLLITDRENYRIQVFDTNGKFLVEWDDVGSPWGLALYEDGGVWMADGHNNRVLKLTRDGKIAGMLGGAGKLPGQFNFAHHIAVAPDGALYVSEILNWRAQKFVPNREIHATQ